MKMKTDIDAAIKKFYKQTPNYLTREVERKIKEILDASGLMYRIFSRQKSEDSILEKMKDKAEKKYIPKGKKMQDFVGIRIVLYFADDIDICLNMLNNCFEMIEGVHDCVDPEVFRPMKKNYIYSMPEELEIMNQEEREKCLIDNTFEVQVRTIFSEGWHEVEHDLRYKHKMDWENEVDLQRKLNGLLAVLEMCDNNIVSICDQFVRNKFRSAEWESVLRNHFRIRVVSGGLSNELQSLFDSDKELVRKILQCERGKVIELLAKTRLPRKLNNLVYLANLCAIQDGRITGVTPFLVKEKCEKVLSST